MIEDEDGSAEQLTENFVALIRYDVITVNCIIDPGHYPLYVSPSS